MKNRRPFSGHLARPASTQAVYVSGHQRPTNPDEGLAFDALANAQWAMLETRATEALGRDPSCAWALKYLPFSLTKQHRHVEADAAYKEALKHPPVTAELKLNMASWLLDMSRTDEALPLLESLTKEHPLHSLSWGLLSSAHYQQRAHQQGFRAASQAFDTAHTVIEKNFALRQRAIHRRELGQIKEAIADCEAGLHLAPNDIGHHTNRMLFMLAMPGLNDAQIRLAAQDFAQSAEAPWQHLWPSFEDRDRAPNRRLKIGFLSPDFRNHSVMYFTEGLLAQLDRTLFEVHALYLHPAQDDITRRVKTHADVFVDVSGLDTGELTTRVRALSLDVVVDLAGHTGHNGLAAMARRLAPVQVSMLGFPATTGLKAIDYRISDPITDAPDAQALYAEQLWRLNALFGVYRPCIRNPLYRYQPAYAVKPAPALTNGWVTFGSCTNLGRLTDTVLSTWAQVLDQVPNARLLIEGKDLDEPEFALSYRQRCEKLGIDPNRLTLVGMEARNQYLTYHQIDVVLDPFPLNSGTTSFDSLWMGVPLVTLAGNSFKERIGAGLLTALGLDDLVTNTPSNYVAAAVALASDVDNLNQLRTQLRAHMEASVLMNEPHYVAEFAHAVRQMWWHWACPERFDHEGHTDLAQPEPGPVTVAIAPGTRLALVTAYDRLQTLTNAAKAEAPDQRHPGTISHPAWIAVQDMAEAILNTCANDPVALASLAEIENAHGHTDFAGCYLAHAMQAMGQSNPGAVS